MPRVYTGELKDMTAVYVGEFTGVSRVCLRELPDMTVVDLGEGGVEVGGW